MKPTILVATLATLVLCGTSLVQAGPCAVNRTILLEYLSTINNITTSTLTAFGRAKPLFLTFTTPLNTGLTIRQIPTPPTISTLSASVNTSSTGMKQLSRTLLSMVDSWNNFEAEYLALENPNATSSYTFIGQVNALTRNMLTDLGRAFPSLLPVTGPLSRLLLFSPVTRLGYTTFNINLPILRTGENLKLLAGNLTLMATKWEQVMAKYGEMEDQLCDDSSSAAAAVSEIPVVPEVVSRTPASPASSAVTPQLDQTCLASRPTTTTFLTALHSAPGQVFGPLVRSRAHLGPFVAPLMADLRFRPAISGNGNVINRRLNPLNSSTEDLKVFAGAILELVKQFETLEANYTAEKNRDCRVAQVATTEAPIMRPTVVPEASEGRVNAVPSNRVPEMASTLTTSTTAPAPVSAIAEARTHVPDSADKIIITPVPEISSSPAAAEVASESSSILPDFTPLAPVNSASQSVATVVPEAASALVVPEEVLHPAINPRVMAENVTIAAAASSTVPAIVQTTSESSASEATPTSVPAAIEPTTTSAIPAEAADLLTTIAPASSTLETSSPAKPVNEMSDDEVLAEVVGRLSGN